MKKLLGCTFLAILATMAWVTWRASLDRDVFTAGAELWRDPWGKATLFDAYFAFFAVFLWIAARERGWFARGLWFVLLMTLGNFAIASYALLSLRALGKDQKWYEIFDPRGSWRRRSGEAC